MRPRRGAPPPDDALDGVRDKAAARRSTRASEQAKRWGIGGVVGSSPHPKAIFANLGKLHPFGRTSVMITGESGTGFAGGIVQVIDEKPVRFLGDPSAGG